MRDERQVGFRSLRESIDTTTAGGRLVFHLFGALAQFEREIIRDRTLAGLSAARARGRVGGRPSKLSPEQRRQARKMYDARELTVEQIGKVLGVSRTSIYRALSPKAATPAAPEATPAATTAPAAAPAAATAVEAEPEPQDKLARPVANPPAKPGSAASSPPARSRGRSRRWYLVQADPVDLDGPVVVVSSYTTQKAAAAELVKANNRMSGQTSPAGSSAEAEEQVLLQVRTAEQITSRLVFDSETKRGAVQPGPPT